MRALMDVNVIIALLDPDHAFHERAHHWWAANARHGWASCPLTENGVVRIMSNPNYSPQARFTPGDLVGRLIQFAEKTNHEFWPDDVSLRDEDIFATERIHSSRQLTDLYLLALAVKHHGRLVTFDHRIPLSSVCAAKAANLCMA
jgi:toxin-antitoxin system PIN domain toxin